MKAVFSLSALIIIFLALSISSKNNYRGFDNAEGNVSPENNRSNLTAGVNYRIFPGPDLQVESSVCVNSMDSLTIAGTSITNYIESGYSTGFYLSTNEGASWSGTDRITNNIGFTITTVGDPVININNTGRFIITYISPSPFSGIDYKVGASYSTNNGTGWTTVIIPGVDSADKPISTTDNIITSPYFGRTYAVYDELNFNQTKTKAINFSFTSNGGVSWDTARRITNIDPRYQNRLIGDVSIGPGGILYVLWFTNPSYLGFSKSINGGASWSVNNDTLIQTDASVLSNSSNDVYLQGVPVIKTDNTGGTRNGWIYAVNLERFSDSIDVVIHRSTNGGNSWVKNKVNRDSAGIFKLQAMPAMNIDRYGGINILYYDTRNSPGNDSFEVYMSRSDDGGNNFRDIKVSDHKFKPERPAVPLFYFEGYIGSYIGISSGKDKIIPFWYDNSSGIYQLWTSSIYLLPVFDVKIIPQGFYDTLNNKLRMKDTLRAYLRNPASPYAIADSSSAVVDSVSFTASFKFRPDLIPLNYFLEIKHRNSIETWSANPLNYTYGSKTTYDFTSDSSKAYGNNLKHKGGKWCIYSGDNNQDGFVNLADVIRAFNAAAIFSTGYVQEDCNGDRVVNLLDIIIVFNNSAAFVKKEVP